MVMSNVRFESIDVFDGERGIVLYGSDGGPIEDIVWRNIRLFMIDWKDEQDSGAVFDFEISRRDGLPRVEDCMSLLFHFKCGLIIQKMNH
jgi:hypothetical protein